MRGPIQPAVPGRRAALVLDPDRRLLLAGDPSSGGPDFLELPGHPESPEAHVIDVAALLENVGPAIGSGRLTSAVHAPRRFEVEVTVHETNETAFELPEAASFRAPAEVLALWQSRRALVSPHVLRAAESLVNDEAPWSSIFNGRPPVVLEPLFGVRQIPLETPTLPPAAHTNTYLLGHERILIVDPATYDEGERQKLAREIGRLEAQGKAPFAVLLTHHHADHMGAANWVRERYSVPVLAHPVTRDLLEGSVEIDETIEEGHVFDLGRDERAEHEGPFRLEALFTPGHAPGHLVLADRRRDSRAMIVGDMVAAIGTIIVDPPEGDMSLYIASLERLLDAEPGPLFAAHGPVIVDGPDKLSHYIRHRLSREAKVLGALQQLGRGRPEDLLPSAYDDTPEALYAFAARSCLAHLLKLVADGRAARDGDAFLIFESGPETGVSG